MKIIEISTDEFGRVKPLWEQLNQTHHQNSNYWKEHFEKLTYEERIRNLQSLEKKKIFAAVIDENLVGYCIVSIKGRYGEIDSIFVQEACRKLGVGDKLVSKSLEWLSENNIQDIRVEVAEGNESVRPFYEKFGFKKSMTTLKMSS